MKFIIDVADDGADIYELGKILSNSDIKFALFSSENYVIRPIKLDATVLEIIWYLNAGKEIFVKYIGDEESHEVYREGALVYITGYKTDKWDNDLWHFDCESREFAEDNAALYNQSNSKEFDSFSDKYPLCEYGHSWNDELAKPVSFQILSVEDKHESI